MNIERLNPITEEEAAAMVSRQTRDDLAERVMKTTPDDVPTSVRPGWSGRRRLLVGIPLAVTVATAAMIAVSVAEPDQRVGPVSVGPNRAEAAALSFRKEGDSLVVTVNDPVADPARYKKEFAAYGMDIDLTLAPVPPRRAGTLVFMETSEGGHLETILAEGRCGSEVCGVGVKVPMDYKGHARIVFGRAARPGEMYDEGPGDVPGEGVGLPDVPGHTVAEAWAALEERKITRVLYRYVFRGSDRPYPDGLTRDQVKPEWYVHDALAGTDDQVILFVGPEKP